MSTKWNNHQRLQKTPAVCKKGPPDLPLDLRDFHGYPLQAYASWTRPGSTGLIDISGMTVLDANPAISSHAGRILGTNVWIDLLLVWNPIAQAFTYTVSLFENEMFSDARFVEFNKPTNQLPFAAGLFTWGDSTTSEIVTSKIYS